MTQPHDLFIIGTASLDTLHLPQQPPVNTIGGAGVYTALAAHKSGSRTGLFGPYPDPMPPALEPVAKRLNWRGPHITAEEVARLEIAHYGGGKAQLLNASWGAEPNFTPHNIPTVVTEAGIVHVAALSSAQRQLTFVQTLRALKPTLRLSVGTYGRLVYEQTATVQQIFALADLFFMNENEATGLFGSVEQATTSGDRLLFVTVGERGAWVITATQRTHIPAIPTTEVDPTGAGDTFCGATLAHLSRGLSAVAAAQQAVGLASQTVSHVGPQALLSGKVEGTD